MEGKGARAATIQRGGSSKDLPQRQNRPQTPPYRPYKYMFVKRWIQLCWHPPVKGGANPLWLLFDWDDIGIAEGVVRVFSAAASPAKMRSRKDFVSPAICLM
eukprot:Hpha_TRINITY_DN15875_c0_g1::TRINITY_DN15875_c0_g1_i2::g.189400::m.189400